MPESGSQAEVSLPLEFFSEMLPRLEDAGLLKLILYAYWARAARGESGTGLTFDDLLSDESWLPGGGSATAKRAEITMELLEQAAHLGLLLTATDSDSGVAFYFINDGKGRARMEQSTGGSGWRPEGTPIPKLAKSRPNLFVLYEQNIGPLTPILAERLREAEAEYPSHWIEEAVTIAVTNNVRKWRYIEAILDDWKTRGRDEREDQGDPAQARRRYVQGRFSDFIEH